MFCFITKRHKSIISNKTTIKNLKQIIFILKLRLKVSDVTFPYLQKFSLSNEPQKKNHKNV